jgi:enoyl-CoA hydratase
MVVARERSTEGPALLRIERPPVNALDVELIEELSEAIGAELEAGASALVLTGSGRAFSAGIDTKAVAGATPAQLAASIRSLNAMVSALYSAPVPVVAAINGHALGGGLVIALACDVRVASARDDYVLALNEAEAGVAFPAGPLRVVQAALDPSVASALCLSSRRIGAEEALALHVVDELSEPERLEHRALERAAEMASFGAYREVKRQLRAAAAADLHAIAEGDGDPVLDRTV